MEVEVVDSYPIFPSSTSYMSSLKIHSIEIEIFYD
jgi:hypothetical protein